MKENNEIIARFMGAIHVTNNLGEHWLFKTPPSKMATGMRWTYLCYHDSFDWLMPVWMKFRDLQFEKENESKHGDWVISLQWYLFSSDSPARLADRLTYAIEWYNTTKQQEQKPDPGYPAANPTGHFL